MLPTIGRVVWYRSRTGAYTVPAMITCTTETLYEPAVEMGYIPALSSPTHVHLTVLSPGVPELGANSPDWGRELDDPRAAHLQAARHRPPGAESFNLAGTYQEWDVRFFDPRGLPVSCRPLPVDGDVEMLAGSWTWPERV